MNQDQLSEMCRQFIAGEIETRQFLSQCLATATAASDDATIDVQRLDRCGFPEVVYGEGKSLETIFAAIEALTGRQQKVLVTRVAPEQAAAIQAKFSSATYNQSGRTLRIDPEGVNETRVGRVALITAGSTDRDVAEEARDTLDWMGVEVVLLSDVGVAGPHRLAVHWEKLQEIDAAVVVAGMEGALPSVVGGYVACPVVAVPTSVGYGASFGGVAALLGMLNSCSSNVTVVNIDAGFKGGYVAGLIARRTHASD